jgi:hypothetical protein
MRSIPGDSSAGNRPQDDRMIERSGNANEVVRLFQRLRGDLDILLAGSTLFPILAHPSLEALAGGGIAIAELQGGDFGIGD